MMPLENHVEVNEDGCRFQHPGYFLMQCPACRAPFVLARPVFGEVRMVSAGLTCGKSKCLRDMGLPCP